MTAKGYEIVSDALNTSGVIDIIYITVKKD